MRSGSSPMIIWAHCSTVSLEPPSPIPVSPESVSTVTIWKLWLKRVFESGFWKKRIRLIFIFGSAASIRAGRSSAAAEPDRADWRKVRRFISVKISHPLFRHNRQMQVGFQNAIIGKGGFHGCLRADPDHADFKAFDA